MPQLNDVQKGGETAFAQAGVRATPKRGSAVFWYNMLSSGDRDELTYHGGCPVIFGEKFRKNAPPLFIIFDYILAVRSIVLHLNIVATQWMYFSDQGHLQCHPDRSKPFEVLVNGKSKYM